MLKKDKTATINDEGYFWASNGKYQSAKRLPKPLRKRWEHPDEKPQAISGVFECKKGRGIKRWLDYGGPTGYRQMVEKTSLRYIAPSVWNPWDGFDKLTAGPIEDYEHRLALLPSNEWDAEEVFESHLQPVESDRTWWLYSGVFYVTKEDLKSADVAVLANEGENHKRLKLEKAYALQAMREEFEKGNETANRKGREPIPQEVKLMVWQRDGGRCVDCQSQDDLEFDHVIPLAMGGSNTERNLQLLCAVCNRRKGATLG